MFRMNIHCLFIFEVCAETNRPQAGK